MQHKSGIVRSAKKVAGKVVLVGAAVASAVLGAGCGDADNEAKGYGDVPIGDRESTEPLIIENADGFPNQSVKCVEFVDNEPGETGERVVGDYLIFATTHKENKPSAVHIERLPDGVQCPDPGDLGFGR